MLSGASGGGKSTLLDALARRGHATVEEPGRAIVREELAKGGDALPNVNLLLFAERAGARAIAMHEAARGDLVFFDRSLVDAVAVFARLGAPLPPSLDGALARVRYDETVFMVPPWPEIFVADAERRHGLDAAVSEYEHLLTFYPAAGYRVVIVPRAPVSRRADFVEGVLAGSIIPSA